MHCLESSFSETKFGQKTVGTVQLVSFVQCCTQPGYQLTRLSGKYALFVCLFVFVNVL